MDIRLKTGLFPEGDMEALEVPKQRSNVRAAVCPFPCPFIYLRNMVCSLWSKAANKVYLRDTISVHFCELNGALVCVQDGLEGSDQRHEAH